MRTDDLIDRLAELPVARSTPGALLARDAAIGFAVSAAAMLFWLNVRPDLAQAASTSAFWMKLAYAALVAAIAFPATTTLSRPTGGPRRALLMMILPLIALSVLAFAQLAAAEPADRMRLIMGHSARVCTVRIGILSLPILAAVFHALRQLAPTRPVAAGLFAGLFAGAAGTIVYAFHCDESAAPFVAVWYTLGMAAIGLVGGLIGRSTLRW